MLAIETGYHRRYNKNVVVKSLVGKQGDWPEFIPIGEQREKERERESECVCVCMGQVLAKTLEKRNYKHSSTCPISGLSPSLSPNGVSTRQRYFPNRQ